MVSNGIYRLRRSAAACAALLLGVTLAGCGSDEPEAGTGGKTLTVWSLENLTDRVQATQRIVDKFSQQTGVKVNLVAVDENQFTQLITNAAAAGKLPDVVGALPLAGVATMAGAELLDTDAAKAVIDQLGAATFSPRALELDTIGGKQAAVPSDGWAQLLVYRKDLFDKAGLPAPDTFDKIRQAAQSLNRPGLAGITAATVPNDAFTEQSFENFALANGCELVDQAGKIILDSPACVQTFQFYGDLMRTYSVRGAQDVDTTRASYFSGKAAMVVWSSFILDEMAGLRKDAIPSCPECAKDPAFLAKNSGIVTGIQGPSGTEPAQFGELTSWALTNAGNATSAKSFVSFMMNDGYTDWLAIAPEGKFPARKGTAEDAAKFTTAWDSLPAGVDTKKPLKDIYPAEVLEALRTSPDTFRRWALPQGQGTLLGATLGELPVPKAVNAQVSGELDAAGAAKRAADDVRAIQTSQK
ncbi:MAG TPA: extracellular solute-binding protein [Actinoplanes sp.]|jgi:multiple sugar transport system substrate-binding protein